MSSPQGSVSEVVFDYRETFNKHQTVNVLKDEGLPVVRSLLVENSKAATEEFLDSLRHRVGYPCVVKPNKGTASAGEARRERFLLSCLSRCQQGSQQEGNQRGG